MNDYATKLADLQNRLMAIGLKLSEKAKAGQTKVDKLIELNNKLRGLK